MALNPFTSLSKLIVARPFLAALVVALVASGCARKPKPLAPSAYDQDTLFASGHVGEGPTVPGSLEDFVLNVSDRVTFETDSAVLSPNSRAVLDRQAQWLARYPAYRVVLEGHADERGTRAYNVTLGARRATVARNYLGSRGIVAGRITTTSFGKERPASVCSAPKCWSRNRRAVTVLAIN